MAEQRLASPDSLDSSASTASDTAEGASDTAEEASDTVESGDASEGHALIVSLARRIEEAADSFKTDTDITRAHGCPHQKVLYRWDTGSDHSREPLLPSNVIIGTSGEDRMDGEASWDQFEVNERLYGVRTSFDELLYTTPLPNQPKLRKRAEAVAKQIEHEAALRRKHASVGCLAAHDDGAISSTP